MTMIEKALKLVEMGKGLGILLYTIQYLFLIKTITYKIIKNIY